MSDNLLYVLTDGGRARLVERSPTDGHYVTVEEIDHTERLRTLRQDLRASPPVRTFSSHSPDVAGVGPEDFVRPAKEAFMAEVAERAAGRLRSDRLDGVVVAAPSRLIGAIRLRLEAQHARVAGSVRKDLTKAPDETLGSWLDDAARASAP